MTKQYFITKIESYEGEDTFIRCGDDEHDFVYVVVSLDGTGSANVVDAGYRSREEAEQAWPEAKLRGAANL